MSAYLIPVPVSGEIATRDGRLVYAYDAGVFYPGSDLDRTALDHLLHAGIAEPSDEDGVEVTSAAIDTGATP